MQSQKGSAIFQSGSPSNISGCYFYKNYASQDGEKPLNSIQAPLSLNTCVTICTACFVMRFPSKIERIAMLSVCKLS